LFLSTTQKINCRLILTKKNKKRKYPKERKSTFLKVISPKSFLGDFFLNRTLTF